jgi:hypothetical protein
MPNRIDRIRRTRTLVQDGIDNPFARPADMPVSPEVETWARQLCISFGDRPERLIGNPANPAWRAWVGYAELAVKAASALGYQRQERAA